MKNLLQITPLLLLLFAGLIGDLLAQAPQFLVAATDDPRRVQISFAQPAMSDVSLKIETEDGRLLHRETLENITQFTRAYQLQDAPTGTYKFSLEASSGTVVQTYRLTPEVAPLRMNWSLISPHKVWMQVEGLPGGEGLVQIFTKQGSLLYETEMTFPPEAGRTFNLAPINEREVVFSVSSGSASVSKTISLRK
jgi:hypothetical protein